MYSVTDQNALELAQALFEECGDALFLFDPDTEQLLDANPMAQKLTGCTHKELLKFPVSYHFRSEISGGLHRLRLACRKTGPFHSQDGFLLRQNLPGHWLPVNLTVSRLHAEPKTLGLITARDISAYRESQRELERQESQLRQVLHSVSAALWSLQFNDEGECVSGFCSPVIEEITGRSVEYFEGSEHAWLSIVHPEDRKIVEGVFTRLLHGVTTHEEPEYRIIKKDGSVGWVQDSILSRRETATGLLRLDGVFSNVTLQKGAEILEDKRQQILELIAHGEQLEVVLDELVKLIESLSSGHLASVMLVKPDKKHLYCASGPNLPEEYVKLLKHIPIGPDIGSCGAAAALKQNVIINDILSHPNWAPFCHLIEPHGLRACWSIPILNEQREVFGTFAVYARVPYTPEEKELDTLQLCTHLASIAIERQLAKETLESRKLHYEHLLNQTSGVVSITDRDGIILQQFGTDRYLGDRSPEERVGHSCLELVHPEDAPPAREAYANLTLKPGATITHRLRLQHTDGEYRWVEAICQNLLDDPLFRGIVIHSRDITEWKNIQESVQQNQAWSQSLLENLDQAIFFKDRDCRFIQVNRRVCEALGKQESEILGKSDFDFFPRDLAEKYRADDLRVIEKGEQLETEEETLIEGQMRTVRVSKTPIRDAQGGICGVLGIYWDVTEQRRLESQLRHSGRMEAVGRLAGGVAHDFNNLLTIILGNLALLSRPDIYGEDPQELLKEAELAGLRAAELTSQMLSLSRKAPSKPRPMFLLKIIDEISMMVRRTFDPRINLEIDTTDDLWTVFADPCQMHQVLLNLCLNAQDAMPEGGQLTIETANVSLKHDDVRLNLDACVGDHLCLRVRDTGTGIPQAIRQRIFDPFFTTKGADQGTGLGLSQVFGIIQQHNGWIVCDSVVNHGTCFEIYLPRTEEPVQEIENPETEHTHFANGQESILLVDDEHLLRNLGKTILEMQGYQVHLAENGRAALEFYREAQDEIDLIILDLTMPGLSGLETLQQLLEIDEEVKVLLSSGYSEQQLTPEQQGQICGFLPKPYKPEVVTEKVRRALDAKQPAH